MTHRSFLRPAVARQPVFPGVPTADAPGEGVVALLHLNECPFPPSPLVVEAIARQASGLNRYAEPRPAALAARLAAMFGSDPENIVIGNGSDELLALISVMALEAGDNAVMPTPSFPRYRIAAAIQGAEPRLVRVRADGANDVDRMLAAIDDRTRVVYVCTPNNPSGAPLEPGELARMIAGVPDHVLLVVDEAYAEFHVHEGGEDALGALRQRRGPWISARTFSKAYALAGMRIGYAICSGRDVAEGLVRVKLNFNLNRLAVAAAMAALDDADYARRCIASAVAERERLAEELRKRGLSPLPSRANFISFDLKRNSIPIMAAMAERGVLVREWRDPGFETYMRISIGLPEENDLALSALDQSLSAA